MRVLIDTEFTSLTDPRLIAIGAVVDDSHFFYGIVTDYPARACTRFVVEHVLPVLDAHPANTRGPYDQVARAFADWLVASVGLDEGCEIVGDDECDIELARSLIDRSQRGADLPPLRYVLHPISDDALAESEFLRFFEDAPERRRHNALDDAFAYRAALRSGP